MVAITDDYDCTKAIMRDILQTSQELQMLSRSLFCLCLCLPKVSQKSLKSLSKASQKPLESLSKASQNPLKSLSKASQKSLKSI